MIIMIIHELCTSDHTGSVCIRYSQSAVEQGLQLRLLKPMLVNPRYRAHMRQRLDHVAAIQ